MDGMSDLVEFVRARRDEDEQVARQVTGSGRWSAYMEGGDDGWAIEDAEKGDPGAIVGDEAMTQHIARHDPARVLAEVAAKRALLAQWDKAERQMEELQRAKAEVAADVERENRGERVEGHLGVRLSAVRREEDYLVAVRIVLWELLRGQAAVHADHPDYQQEWRP